MGVDFAVYKGSESGQIVEAKGHRDLGPTEVVVKISHRGVCGTDEHFRHADQGLGHEGVGVITETGSMVDALSDFRVGDRVGMSWVQKICEHCDACLSGELQSLKGGPEWLMQLHVGHQNQCINKEEFGTANHDQGCFGSALAWDVSCLFKVPDEIESEYAGPLMCGGATVWSPLYNFGIKPGSRVGIVGVGGLGHLGIQFAAKMGMEVVAFSGSENKKQQAMELGASEFHVAKGPGGLDKVGEISELLITASVLLDMVYMPVLALGALVFPLTVSTKSLKLTPLGLIGQSLRVIGNGTASTTSIRAMLRFAAKQGVKPIIEKFPMTRAGVEEAMAKLREGKVRYRGVLVAH
ncbi:hypothetical protein OQA88_11886 [Cercophora sp. LCS_1]